jgi:putative selenium metabolism protein SsnA
MRSHNKLTLPGFVCAHTHLYSSLARGMPAPAEAPRNFVEILERVWWRLDRALDAEAVEISALVGAIEAAKAGCTTLIDHHASPGRGGSAVDGSLDLVAAAVAEVGLRAIVCYEVSDRNGADEARAGVRENDRFLARIRREPPHLVRAMVGAHAAFTLSNETAEALADVARRHRAGVHIHVAEDAVDARKVGRSTVAWLQERGLLDARSLLAHCVHVDEADVARIRDAGAWVVHNPRSNANNAVGYARPSRFGARLLLGTDGIGADMRAEAQFAFFAAREHGDALDAGAVLARNRAFAAACFGIEELGDSVTLEYASPTPVNDDNFGGHLLFGLGAARVRDVVVDGHVVVREGVCVNVDEERVYARAREIAAKLWSRL